MSHDILTQYFGEIEQQLDTLPNSHTEQSIFTVLSTTRANLKLRIRFSNKYLLAISEAILVTNNRISQIDYRYHFQDEENRLIFRYDSTPHFPNLSSFPHHKHLPDTAIATDKPDVFRVLQEASGLIRQKSKE